HHYYTRPLHDALPIWRHREHDIALVRDLRDEADERPEGLELDVGREAGGDADRNLSADLEHRVLAAHREQLRLREDRGKALGLRSEEHTSELQSRSDL